MYNKVNDMKILSNGYIVIFDSTFATRFTSSSDYSKVTYVSSGDIFAASSRDTQFFYIFGGSTSNLIYVDDGNDGRLLQSLSYTSYSVKAIDASDSYLAIIDNYGYLSIASYEYSYPSGGSSAWIIFLIVGVVALAIVVCIIKISKARKAKQAMKLNNYNNLIN